MAAVVTLAGDVLKGLLPVIAARLLSEDAVVIAATGGAADPRYFVREGK